MMNKYSDFILPASNSLEENARLWAIHYNFDILPGHGLFFDFSNVPEFGELCLKELTHKHGWILEKPFFIRRQDFTNN